MLLLLLHCGATACHATAGSAEPAQSHADHTLPVQQVTWSHNSCDFNMWPCGYSMWSCGCKHTRAQGPHTARRLTAAKVQSAAKRMLQLARLQVPSLPAATRPSTLRRELVSCTCARTTTAARDGRTPYSQQPQRSCQLPAKKAPNRLGSTVSIAQNAPRGLPLPASLPGPLWSVSGFDEQEGGARDALSRMCQL
jgi:hypothetical protein